MHQALIEQPKNMALTARIKLQRLQGTRWHRHTARQSVRCLE
jgi:hypothetical protein